MANVIKTVMTYPLNGTTRDFNIPFEYLARKFIQVTLIGVDRKILVLNTDYRFSTKTTITTTQAWGPAQGYQQIEIRRYTSATERLVDFTDGSILRAYDLNIAQIQTMHVAEEARDLTADTIGVNNEGHLDARGRRIVNLANAVNDRDAVPLGQLKEMNQSAWDSMNKAHRYRNEAQGFRDEAEQFRNQASASQVAAANSQAAAKVSETNAATSASNANAHKNAAANSQAAAAASAAAAKTSEGNALAQADRAKTEADRAKTEADKLGNWNQLAGAVESVAGTTVKWKGTSSINALEVRDAGVALRGEFPKIDFFHKHAQGNYTVRIETMDGGLHVASPNTQFDGGIKAVGNVVASGGTLSGNKVSIADGGYSQVTTTFGGQAYVNQLNNQGAYSQTITGNQDGSIYYPIIKQYGRRSNGYITSFSMGMTSMNTSAYHQGTILLAADNGTVKTWQFKTTGEFISQGNITVGGATYQTDGNIKGSAWSGGYLSTHFNSYKKKTKGWTKVMDGSTGGGVSRALSQDVRFRQCWFTVNGHLMPVSIGGDGTYYTAGWGRGWIKFQISNNGRTFKNIQDDSTIPTAIWVENE